MSRLGDVIERLAATIEARRGADPATSWSARLIGDPPLAAKKLAEEAVEAAIAAVRNDPAALTAESADLIYHWLAVLAGAGVSLEAVAEALEAREGRSGVDEKASRPG
ncbi:MAG: phosphoribosyl-ATP diphosphatase [Caulobacteraceae bacterium]